jgi:hypothetical protein
LDHVEVGEVIGAQDDIAYICMVSVDRREFAIVEPVEEEAEYLG